MASSAGGSSCRDIGAELATKSPADLRREVFDLRAELLERSAERDAARDRLSAAAAEHSDEMREREAAHEARFEDMRSFMHNLLRNLKSENGWLRSQLEATGGSGATDGLEEFLKIEAAAAAQTDGDERSAASHAQPRGLPSIAEASEEEGGGVSGSGGDVMVSGGDGGGAGGVTEGPSSPLKEARMHRLIIDDDLD